MPATSTVRPDQNRVQALLTAAQVDDINTVSAFVSQPSRPLLHRPGTVYILAGNAILPTTAALFDHIAQIEEHVTLLIAGGIGHSTSFLYDAIRRHPMYSQLYPLISSSPEAVVLEKLLYEYWPDLASRIAESRLTLLIEDKSTNCGANAVESKRVLDERELWPERIVIVQDPTMNRRTLAGFEKIYAEDVRRASRGMPVLDPYTFTPKLRPSDDGGVEWDDSLAARGIHNHELWDYDRFVSLVVGEIPRMRDGPGGYGPNGAGFIAHVDIPDGVEGAWRRLNKVLEYSRDNQM